MLHRHILSELEQPGRITYLVNLRVLDKAFDVLCVLVCAKARGTYQQLVGSLPFSGSFASPFATANFHDFLVLLGSTCPLFCWSCLDLSNLHCTSLSLVEFIHSGLSMLCIPIECLFSAACSQTAVERMARACHRPDKHTWVELSPSCFDAGWGTVGCPA